MVTIFICCLNGILVYTWKAISRNIWHPDCVQKSECFKWSSNVLNLDKVESCNEVFWMQRYSKSLKPSHANELFSFYLGGTLGTNRALLNSKR